MEDLESALISKLKPYEDKLKKLTETLNSQDGELLTLKYALKGLNVTIKELTRKHPPIYKRTQPIKKPFERPAKPKSKTVIETPPKLSKASTLIQIGKIPSTNSSISPIKKVSSTSSLNKDEKSNKVLVRSSTSISPLKRRSSSPYNSPLLKKISFISEEGGMSPVRDGMVDVIQEEVEIKRFSKKMPLPYLNRKIKVLRPKVILAINTSEISRIISESFSSIRRNFWFVKYVKIFKMHEEISQKSAKLIYAWKKRIQKLIFPDSFIERDIVRLQLNLRKLLITETIKVNPINPKFLRTLVNLQKFKFNKCENNSLINDLIKSLALYSRTSYLELCFPYQQEFWPIISTLLTQNSNETKIGLRFYLRDQHDFIHSDQILSLNWRSLSRLDFTLNHYVSELEILVPDHLPNLQILTLVLEAGCKIETVNSLENLTELQSLNLQVKLPLRGCQNFFKQCTFPNKLSELSLDFVNIPVREIFPHSKEFNPYLEKKFENHDVYGPFARRIQRLSELRTLNIKILSSRLFESWNTYIVTSLIGNRTRLKRLNIEAPSCQAGAEPFDIEELLARISGNRSYIKELRVKSYLIEYGSGKSIKFLPKLEHVFLSVDAEELLCQFRIYNLFDHVSMEKILSISLPIEQYPTTAIPLVDKICQCRNLRQLSLNINGESLSVDEFQDIIGKIGNLNKLEVLILSIFPFEAEENVFENVRIAFEKNLPYLKRFELRSKFYMMLTGFREIKLMPHSGKKILLESIEC